MRYNISTMVKQDLFFRCIAYKEKDDSFSGVCLDLDIVEEDHATLEEAILSLNDAISSHVQAASKLGFPDELTFRPAPKEYWDKLRQITKVKQEKPFISPFQLFTVLASQGRILTHA